MYHSISDAAFDPWELCVSPADFAEHLEVLSNRARVFSLGDMLGTLDRRPLPHRSVAITFDDGYADNLHAVKPLLEQYDAPATVFVTAGMIGSRDNFWWDELARLTLAPTELAPAIELDIAGRSFHFDLGEDARVRSNEVRYKSWRFHEPSTNRRHLLYRNLWQRLQKLPETARRRALYDLRWQVRTSSHETVRLRVMDAGEIGRLASGGLVEIGAHTMTHPVLARIPVADQVDEITRSKAAIEEILDRPVANFSYPHGGRNDYTDETVDAVRNANLQSACTTNEGWLRPGMDRYQLPRIHVPPTTGAEFGRLLDTWL